jgi:hypothetical protein
MRFQSILSRGVQGLSDFASSTASQLPNRIVTSANPMKEFAVGGTARLRRIAVSDSGAFDERLNFPTNNLHATNGRGMIGRFTRRASLRAATALTTHTCYSVVLYARLSASPLPIPRRFFALASRPAGVKCSDLDRWHNISHASLSPASTNYLQE